jgi:hypothetical protein
VNTEPRESSSSEIDIYEFIFHGLFKTCWKRADASHGRNESSVSMICVHSSSRLEPAFPTPLRYVRKRLEFLGAILGDCMHQEIDETLGKPYKALKYIYII